MAYKPLSTMTEAQRARYREANRRNQALYRARHPAEAAALQRLSRWKRRLRALAAGWVPMRRAQIGRLGGLAAAARR